MAADPTMCPGEGAGPTGMVADPVYLGGLLVSEHRFGTCPVCEMSVRLDEHGRVGPHRPGRPIGG